MRSRFFLLISLSVVWLIFTWRFWAPAPADRALFVQDGDFALHIYAPIAQNVERFLTTGQFTLWSAYNRAGSPMLGNIQNGVFYPPHYLVGLAFNAGARGLSIEAFQWEALLHLWLTSLLMAAFLWRALGDNAGGDDAAHGLAAAFGAVAWAYGGTLTGYPVLQVSILFAVSWLPLILLGVQRAISGSRPAQGIALGAVGVALSLLAGHPQVALYGLYLALAYGVILGVVRRLPALALLGRLIALFGVGGLLAAPQLLPALELTLRSARAGQTYAEKSTGFALAELIGLAWPPRDGSWAPLYAGVALPLALAAVLARQNMARFWLGAALLALALALGGLTPLYDLFAAIVPGYSLFRNQERIAVVVACALAVMGAAGLLALLGALRARPRVGALVGVGALALLVVDLFALSFGSANFVADTLENRLRLPESLTAYRQPVEALAWRVDGAAGLGGAGDFFRVPDIYGVGPLALESVEALYTLPVHRLWEILAVRYVTTSDTPPPEAALNRLTDDQNRTGTPFALYELTDPRPPAHLVYDWREASGSAQFAREIMADPRVNLREMAITLAPLPFAATATRPDLSRVDDFRWLTPERGAMTVSTGADALLTLALPDDGGWRAEIDGVPADLVDVYAGLVGVVVRAGEGQRVTLTYWPASLSAGLALAAVGALALAGIAVWVALASRG